MKNKFLVNSFVVYSMTALHTLLATTPTDSMTGAKKNNQRDSTTNNTSPTTPVNNVTTTNHTNNQVRDKIDQGIQGCQIRYQAVKDSAKILRASLNKVDIDILNSQRELSNRYDALAKTFEDNLKNNTRVLSFEPIEKGKTQDEIKLEKLDILVNTCNSDLEKLEDLNPEFYTLEKRSFISSYRNDPATRLKYQNAKQMSPEMKKKLKQMLRDEPDIYRAIFN